MTRAFLIILSFFILLDHRVFAKEAPPLRLPDGLKVIEIPAKANKGVFAVIVSGDGGWAKIDKSIAKDLSRQGIPVAGLDSLKYFWKRKTLQQAGRDLGAIVSFYSYKFGLDSVILIGFSRGADLLPFMINEMPQQDKMRIKLLALLSPSKKTDFEVHLANIWNSGDAGDLPVLPEIRKLTGIKILCFYGEEETDSLALDLDARDAKIIRLKGAHHFNGDYHLISDALIDELSK